MARIFITGSADGLGFLAAKDLIAKGHKVVLHARNEQKAKEAMDKLPGAETAMIADLSNMSAMAELASEINALGGFDSIIHNAGIYQASGKEIFAVNTLAPYILTCLIHRPARLIYLSSDMHKGGRFKPELLRSNTVDVTYSDSKLHILMLSNAVSRKWSGIYANAVNPGWVPTKMGGSGAPDNLVKGHETQVWLATSSDEKAKVSGHYFYHQRQMPFNAEANHLTSQDQLLQICSDVTGVAFP